MSEIRLTVSEEEAGERIDKYLAAQCPELSRSYIQKLFKDQQIAVNNGYVKANYRIMHRDAIALHVPEPVELVVQPEHILLDIQYEDPDVIVVNKPKGMVVHPSPGHASGTLVNGLLYHCRDGLSGINGVMRPGIVHRIDRDTTGLLVVCKNDRAHRILAEQLKEHTITRRYHAIVCGELEGERGVIDAPIGRHPADRLKMAVNQKNGKPAVTHFQVLERFSRYTYVECRLETGRTHQIRVHFSHIHHPLLGDTVYGSQKQPFQTQGQALHAKVLGFHHPSTGEYMEFTSPLPAYFQKILEQLKGLA